MCKIKYTKNNKLILKKTKEEKQNDKYLNDSLKKIWILIDKMELQSNNIKSYQEINNGINR